MNKKKRKKHPNLPNGFGSIKWLGSNRRNPYAVYPPTKEFTADGVPVTQKALAYTDDWYKGFAVLLTYKNGTYDPNKPILEDITNSNNPEQIVEKIIAIHNSNNKGIIKGKTFSEIYEDYYKDKFNSSARKFSDSTKYSTAAAYKNCSTLHHQIFKNLRYPDLQGVVDGCTLKHASKELIVTLIKQMYAYADKYDLCDKDYSVHLKIGTPDDDESGVPFSSNEIQTLWKNIDNTVIKSIIIMIYSGFRIKAYSKNMIINLEDKYFKGGVKTKNSIGRTVPIHEGIYELIDLDLPLFKYSPDNFRKMFKIELKNIGIENYTPHDCRHTFSWLCDKYSVDSLSKRMLLGHSLGSDATDIKYGHRTMDELRTEINKIMIE